MANNTSLRDLPKNNLFIELFEAATNVPAVPSKLFDNRYIKGLGKILVDGVLLASSMVGRIRLDSEGATPVPLLNVPPP